MKLNALFCILALFLATTAAHAADPVELFASSEELVASEPAPVPAPAPAPAPRPSLAGTYSATENKSTVIVIDQHDRILSTSLVIKTGNLAYPIRFPHRLRFDEFTGLYQTRGTVTVNVYYGHYVRACEYPVDMELDVYSAGQAIDVTLVYAANVYLDQWGQCASVGVKRSPFGFTRLP